MKIWCYLSDITYNYNNKVISLCQYKMKEKDIFFMPSNKPIILVRTTEETIDKFKVICQEENRSMSKQAEKMILDLIKDYEQKNGTINVKNINVIDNKGTINM